MSTTRRFPRALVVTAALAVTALGLTGLSSAPASAATAAAPASAAPASSVTCSEASLPLPDPSCTPGARNAAVTQGTIDSTICVSGWTATVRPPTSYTNPLKVQQIAEYGYADTAVADYEEDHLIPLELGGNPTAPTNLWPEPRYAVNGKTAANKDTVENKLKSLVCAGTVTLAAAQQAIATDWMTALAAVGQ